MGLPLLLALALLLLAVMPVYPYSRGWGYRPAVVIALVTFAVLVSMNKGYLSLGYASGAVFVP
jgi:hypothetical protein